MQCSAACGNSKNGIRVPRRAAMSLFYWSFYQERPPEQRHTSTFLIFDAVKISLAHQLTPRPSADKVSDLWKQIFPEDNTEELMGSAGRKKLKPLKKADHGKGSARRGVLSLAAAERIAEQGYKRLLEEGFSEEIAAQYRRETIKDLTTPTER
jgi:hypothetical protein